MKEKQIIMRKERAHEVGKSCNSSIAELFLGCLSLLLSYKLDIEINWIRCEYHSIYEWMASVLCESFFSQKSRLGNFFYSGDVEDVKIYWKQYFTSSQVTRARHDDHHHHILINKKVSHITHHLYDRKMNHVLDDIEIFGNLNNDHISS